jgi:hypothetical protein
METDEEGRRVVEAARQRGAEWAEGKFKEREDEDDDKGDEKKQ